MNEQPRLTIDQIETALTEDLNLKCTPSGDGKLLALFAQSHHCPAMFVLISLQGEDDDLMLRVDQGTRAGNVPQSQWRRALSAINEWHASHRWPRLYLDIEGAELGTIRSNLHLPAPLVANPKYLTDTVGREMSTYDQFWQWAIENKKINTVSEQESESA